MATKRISMISLSQLLADVDMLERELKDLSREGQRGEDFNNQLQEIVERDLKNVEEIQKETSRISQEILNLESKERFLTDAVNTGIQSSQLLVQMETQARGKLGEERRATNQLKDELRCKVETFAKNVENEEIAYMKIPEYMKIIQVEERIKSKSAMFQSMESEKIQVMRRMEVAAKDVAEDREAWRGFKASCLNLAEQWIKMRKLSKEVEKLNNEKGDLNLQVKVLESENKSAPKSSVQTNASNGVNYEAERESNDHGSSYQSVPRPPAPNVDVDPVPFKSHTNSSSISTHAADTDSKSFNLDKPSLMIGNLSSISGSPILPPRPSMFKTPSTASTYVPPTPRTKKLHLQLGTSLLSRRKIGSDSISATASTDINGNNNPPTQTLQLKDGSWLPSTTVPIRIEKDIAKVSSVPIPQIDKPLKSFKLGLTSLFGKKKPSSDVQVSKSNELLTRTPTLPHHEEENVRDNHARKNAEENMDVEEEGMVKYRTKSCQGDSINTRNKCAEYAQQEKEVNAVNTGAITSNSNYLSCRPTVEEVGPLADASTNMNAMKNQKLQGAAKIPSLNVVPTLPIPTSRVSTKPMEVSSSPSPVEGRQAMCVSPGTALSDEKRKALLQQLLESPQTTIVSGSDLNKGVGGKGTSINGAENNGSFFGGEQGNINQVGYDQESTENSFVFFGGGDGNKADENVGDGSFAFSFGGVDGEQDNAKDGSDSFGFSFGGDFEDQMGGGGFSLF